MDVFDQVYFNEKLTLSTNNFVTNESLKKINN